FIQEARAEKSLQALKELASPAARVIRNGKPEIVPAAELVPGDVVLLEAGDRVPADLRLIAANRLEIEESALTGESVPVSKTISPLSGNGGEDRKQVSLGDQRNMASMGTM